MGPSTTIFITDLLDQGIIERTPLLQPGQTLNDVAHGWHAVTGGHINVGSIQEGKNKIMGIMVNGLHAAAPNWTYVEGLIPFNGNFSSVLYEMRAAGVKATSYGNLDSAFIENQYQTRAGMYSQYLRTYRESIGQGLNNAPGSYESGSVTITNRLINGLAR